MQLSSGSKGQDKEEGKQKNREDSGQYMSCLSAWKFIHLMFDMPDIVAAWNCDPKCGKYMKVLHYLLKQKYWLFLFCSTKTLYYE